MVSFELLFLAIWNANEQLLRMVGDITVFLIVLFLIYVSTVISVVITVLIMKQAKTMYEIRKIRIDISDQ